MCLILLAYQQHPYYPLIVAANRDEFYDRPTAPLQPWSDVPEILAGRDLQAGGTWLGISQQQRFAAITNVRESGYTYSADPPSRGKLTQAFLQETATAEHYVATIGSVIEQYRGFNLLLKDHNGLYYLSNRSSTSWQRLRAGLYGISNALLDTPWPKVERGKQALAELIHRPELGRDELLAGLLGLLQDKHQPPMASLPNTGVGLQLEQQLAPIFIKSERYGTRCSTAVLLDQQGNWSISEYHYDDHTVRQYDWPQGIDYGT